MARNDDESKMGVNTEGITVEKVSKFTVYAAYDARGAKIGVLESLPPFDQDRYKRGFDERFGQGASSDGRFTEVRESEIIALHDPLVRAARAIGTTLLGAEWFQSLERVAVDLLVGGKPRQATTDSLTKDSWTVFIDPSKVAKSYREMENILGWNPVGIRAVIKGREGGVHRIRYEDPPAGVVTIPPPGRRRGQVGDPGYNRQIQQPLTRI